MYKYQCSKDNCENTWMLQEGFLNGFTLTCPYCGKGRGIFIEQLKKSDMLDLDKLDLNVENPSMTMKI